MRLEALLELQNPRIGKESLRFGFTGSFMIILSFMRKQEQVTKKFSECKQAHVGMEP